MNRGSMLRLERLPVLGRSLRGLPQPSTVQVALACAGILGLSEGFVFFWLSPLVGTSLVLSTVGLALIFRKQLRERVSEAEERAADAERQRADTSHDPETRLPNRVLLLEQLGREIARAQRYTQELTIAVIELSRYEDFQASWGAETTRSAVLHVAETLRRVARSSDFVARLDVARFAIVLTACSEPQARVFGDRLAMAVSNRPLRSTAHVKVPLYVGIDVTPTQYQSERYRGPLDFLSAAGGDLAPEAEATGGPQSLTTPRQPKSLASDPQALRRQLVRDYYPDGEAQDFADAYREHRNRARRAG